MQITIYHNPKCSTSRNALAAIRAAGHEPHIVEYLKTPLTREEIKTLLARLQLSVRDIVRRKEPLFQELGLAERDVGGDEILDAIVENPILLNRPIVVTPTAAKLCRPSEMVSELLGTGAPAG